MKIRLMRPLQGVQDIEQLRLLWTKEDFYRALQMETTTVEGLYTLESLRKMLHDKEVLVKSVDLLYDIVYNNLKIDNVLKSVKNN